MEKSKSNNIKKGKSEPDVHDPYRTWRLGRLLGAYMSYMNVIETQPKYMSNFQRVASAIRVKTIEDKLDFYDRLDEKEKAIFFKDFLLDLLKCDLAKSYFV